jgi:hypothetical protein
MDQGAIIDQLEELAERFGIQIRYEPISLEEEGINLVGGLCKLRGEKLLIINSKAPLSDKIQALAQALSNFDLDQIYIRPAIRGLIEGDATTRKLMAASDPAK